MPNYIEKDKPITPNQQLARFFGWLVLLILICLVAIMCGACSGEAAPETGTVMNRKYEPEHWEAGYETYYTTEYVCGNKSVYDYNSGKYVNRYSCDFEDVSHQRYEEHHRWYDNEWKLLLRRCEKKDDGKEKCHEGWREVTEDEYDRHNIGNYYPKVKEN